MSQFKVSKGEEASNCSRAKGAETGNNESEEGNPYWGIEICVLSILDLFLLNKPGVLNLILACASRWSPGTLRVY